MVLKVLVQLIPYTAGVIQLIFNHEPQHTFYYLVVYPFKKMRFELV